VLQCVAVCCSVLQCVAVCCSVFMFVAVFCSALQCVAVHCSGAWGFSIAAQTRAWDRSLQDRCGVVCCSVLQYVAVSCSRRVLYCITHMRAGSLTLRHIVF